LQTQLFPCRKKYAAKNSGFAHTKPKNAYTTEEVMVMNKRQRKKRHKLYESDRKCPPVVVAPAGRRADSLGRSGIPVPSEESVREAFQWVTEHQQ
jgi:hypothetical protein